MANHPREFTPEISEGFLESVIRRPAQRRANQRRALARRRAVASGRAGDPGLGLQETAIEGQLSEEIGTGESRLAFQVAGLGREERLIGERRGFETSERIGGQEFLAGESARERELSLTMQRLGLDARALAAKTASRRGFQSSLRSIGTDFIRSRFGIPKSGF